MQSNPEPVLKLPAIFTPGMVVQRDRPWHVWGHATPGARVQAELRAPGIPDGTLDAATAATGPDGTFDITMGARAAGARGDLTVRTVGTSVRVRDLVFGDVWVVGGQSNAQLPLRRIAHRYPREVQEANNPDVRILRAPEAYAFNGPQDDCPGMVWTRCGNDDIAEVSALAYLFADRLCTTAHTPIGIIQAALGGTPIEAWLSEPWLGRLDLLPAHYPALRDERYIRQVLANETQAGALYDEQMDALDEGLDQGWTDPSLDDTQWDTMALDESMRPELRAPGVIWLRTSLDVPARYVGKPAIIDLGTLQDADETSVNGTPVGRTDYQYPPRLYRIDYLDKHLQITIRLKVHYGTGGFTGGKPHTITILDDNVPRGIPAIAGRIDLDRKEDGSPRPWHFKRSVTFRERPRQTFFQYEPAGPYNAVLAPWGKAAITGLVWYQGESNTCQAAGYGDKLIALAQCWRALFHAPDAPFITVQLPNNGLEPYNDWPRLRNEQRRIMTLANTALVTTADLGEDNDLHPVDKIDVADRVAHAALSLAYGSGEPPMGPFAWRATVDPDNRLSIHFTNVCGNLHVSGGTVTLELHDPDTPTTTPLRARPAGHDHLCATIPRDIHIPRGATLRYAWHDCPELAIRDESGLPASPFEIPVTHTGL